MYEKVDFHIHTEHLKCANQTMTVKAIIAKAEELGLEKIAITDHLNAPEFLDKNLLIKHELAEIETDLDVYFGVEANVINPETGAISIDEEQKEKLGCELVIAGVHSCYYTEPDIEGILALQHKLMLAVIRNPLVDVLVHPYWFPGRQFADGTLAWLTDMSHVPEDYIAELGETAVECNTAIESNGSAIWTCPSYTDCFREEYKDYLSKLAGYGVKISISSDAHDINRLGDCQVAGRAVRDAGISEDQLWMPSHN